MCLCICIFVFLCLLILCPLIECLLKFSFFLLPKLMIQHFFALVEIFVRGILLNNDFVYFSLSCCFCHCFDIWVWCLKSCSCWNESVMSNNPGGAPGPEQYCYYVSRTVLILCLLSMPSTVLILCLQYSTDIHPIKQYNYSSNYDIMPMEHHWYYA